MAALKKQHEEELKQAEDENRRKWEADSARHESELEELSSTRQTVTQELHGRQKAEPIRNDRQLADDIHECIFLFENGSFIQISPKIFPGVQFTV